MPAKAPKGPQDHWILGSLPRFGRDPIGLLMDSARDYGDVVSFRFGPQPYFLLRHPDHIQHVLLGNHRNYGKRTWGWKNMRLLLGKGLLTSEGDFWLRQRRIAQPTFHREKIAAFARIMVSASEEMLATWEAPARAGTPLDVSAEMMRVTLRIVGETLLSSDTSRESDEIGSALNVCLHQLMTRTTRPYAYLPALVPTPANRVLTRSMRTLDRVIMGVIAGRRRNPSDRADLLAMLMDSTDEETGERMDDRQLRDEVMTLFLAGHETTANALSWTFYLLSLHPEIRRRLQAEIDSELRGRPPGLADLPKLAYCRMVLSESMRLYPPAWMLTRSAIEEDEIDGHRILKGASIIISSYVTHRHPGFWENPEGFDPERFNLKNPIERPRFAYFPFGGGPRQCIGNEFAMMEALLVLASTAQRFQLDLMPGHPVELDPTITLRPKHGLLMSLHPR